MAAATVLRIRRTDADHHLLVKLTPNGSKPLDVTLVGTEHEHVYHASMREAGAEKLRSTNPGVSVQEWKKILKYLLLHRRTGDANHDSFHGLELVSNISEIQAHLTIVIRRNVQGITQRLGSIRLDQDDGREAVNAFDWVDTAVAHSDELRSQLEAMQTSMRSRQDEVGRLNRELDDLIQAKKEHENELLAKCAALLNAKKMKIRDQQRLIGRMGIKEEPPEEEPDFSHAKSSLSSRAKTSKGKRKAAASPEPKLEKEENGSETEDDREEKQTPPPASEPSSADDLEEDGDGDDFEPGGGAQGVPRVAVGDNAQGGRDVRSVSGAAGAGSAAADDPGRVQDDEDETDDEL